MKAGRAAAGQSFWPPSKDRRTWLLAASVETRKRAISEEIRRRANGSGRISESPRKLERHVMANRNSLPAQLAGEQPQVRP